MTVVPWPTVWVAVTVAARTVSAKILRRRQDKKHTGGDRGDEDSVSDRARNELSGRRGHGDRDDTVSTRRGGGGSSDGRRGREVRGRAAARAGAGPDEEEPGAARADGGAGRVRGAHAEGAFSRPSLSPWALREADCGARVFPADVHVPGARVLAVLLTLERSVESKHG